MTVFTIFQVVLYLLLLVQSSGSRSRGGWQTDIREIQQLKELRTWHVIATLVSVAASILRTWSFKTLDWFFTVSFNCSSMSIRIVPSMKKSLVLTTLVFCHSLLLVTIVDAIQYQLTIRPGHRLVTSGPYAYLLHPSYTGYYFNSIAVWTLLWHQGLFDIFSAFFARVAISLFVPTYYAMTIKTGLVFGISGGLWVVLLKSVISAIQLLERVKNEEAMLKEHFGAEWVQHANKRWKFIPYVY